MKKLDLSYIIFVGKIYIGFGYSLRNCGWNYFQLIYMKDSIKPNNIFKSNTVKYYEGDSIPKECENWVYKINDKWLLFSDNK